MISTKRLSEIITLLLLINFLSNCVYGYENDYKIHRPSAITNLHVRDTSTIYLYPTWNIYLYKPAGYRVPRFYTLSGTDTVTVNSALVSWSTTNATVAGITNNVLTANSSGSAFLIASLDGQSVSVPVRVKAEVRPVEYETNINPYLAQPATGSTNQVPVVVICYIPTPDGINVNTDEAGFAPISNQTINALKAHIQKISTHTKFSLEEGSKFRGYKNPAAVPYVGYKIVDYIYVYEPVPRGFNDPASTSFFGDYNTIINRFNGKRYVDTLGVKEFWLMGYHQGEIVPVESDMSSATTGDISNSYLFADDLPIYSKTYVLYNYNFTREGNESTHNHGHQIESMVDYVANRQDHSTSLFRNNFRGYTNVSSAPFGRCGDTHHPPNTTVDYDYYNYTFVASDIMDWKPEGGTQTMVNASTWGNINYNWPAGTTPNIESNWYIFWMQSLPGQGNQIPYAGKQMTNWWQFLSNWDSSTTKIGLYQNIALPLKLNTFNAYNSGPVNDLKWQMTVDESTAYIQVERSANGIDFAIIKTLSDINNSGSSNYSLQDLLPLDGRNYYRLKIFDKTGNFSYSSIAMVDRNALIKIRVSPNPIKDVLSISGLPINHQSSIELISLSGSRMFLIRTRKSVQTIDMNNFSAGVYIIKIDGGGNTFSQKVVKE